MIYKYFFTITAGRTGSAWLSSFLGDNLKIKSIHEPLEINDFGVRMPDIRLMRTFNMHGNATEVKKFYKRKFDEISTLTAYSETNHTLAKCGMVENIIDHNISEHSCLIVLRRDFVRQCVSYIRRGDFRNITMDWQWYLHQSYRNNIVNFAPFEQNGLLGKALWYVYEMDARQRYYERIYANKIKIVSINLEDVITETGAKQFLRNIGHYGEPLLPGARNQSGAKPDDDLSLKVSGIVATLKYDGDAIVNKYIENGRSLCVPLRTKK